MLHVFFNFFSFVIDCPICSLDSTSSSSPISWILDGPQEITHNFSASFCEISLKMTLYNSSSSTATVCTNTFDSTHHNVVSSSSSEPSMSGWYSLSLENEIKAPSDIITAQESVGAMIWSGSSSTKVHIQPKSSTEIPLEVCVFYPGTYDLSNYAVQWSLECLEESSSSEEKKKLTSGTCQGYPYHITVLPSP